MGNYQGFIRLNPKQKVIMKSVEPYDGQEGFFDKVERGEIAGLDFTRTLPLLGELEEIGYIKIIFDGSTPKYIAISSTWYCYRREYLFHIALPAIVNGLAGVSGGLIVWLLTHIFG